MVRKQTSDVKEVLFEALLPELALRQIQVGRHLRAIEYTTCNS